LLLLVGLQINENGSEAVGNISHVRENHSFDPTILIITNLYTTMVLQDIANRVKVEKIVNTVNVVSW